MEFKDRNGFVKLLYVKKCHVCGNKCEVATQEDNDPEYYTDVYVKCGCGNFIKFKLPVN